jgi:aminoglycoside 6-adenylyltransferase
MECMMRNEQEMLELILNTAKNDERIRAVIMYGSRTNKAAPRDCFQDFDIVYVVTDTASFKKDPNWIDRFGERMTLQMPDDMQDPPPSDDDRFAYLIQLMDGNRIDLTIYPVTKPEQLGQDSLSVLLLDKDGILEPFTPPSDHDYLPKPPNAKEFFNCCNEFWWVAPYVAKGLWRQEITYAKHNLEHYLRDQLMNMLTWQVGIKTEFSRSPGKNGKYLKRYLEPEIWEMLLKTYSDASFENTWDALETMSTLFRQTAIGVAEHFGYKYLYGDDQRVSAHLKHVRFLPKNALEMY